jgi:predicted nucleotidyltransferase
MHKFGLKKQVIQQIRGVFSQFPSVKGVIIYGSRALETYRHNSDIDLTLVGEEITFTELLKIENELDDLLLPYQIDLSIFEKIDNTELVDHIIRVGKLIYEKVETLQGI